MDYKIIDNALPEEEFYKIKSLIFNQIFPWYYNDYVAHEYDNSSTGYFIHDFYNFDKNPMVGSNFTSILPILALIQPRSLMRVRANLYLRTSEIEYHDKHVDKNYDHNGAILYLNTNNGCTVLEDGTKIESLENRILLFNPGKLHSSTSCNDQSYRSNIIINYF